MEQNGHRIIRNVNTNILQSITSNFVILMVVECGINEISTRVIVREERNNRNIFRTPLLVIKVLDRNANKFNDYEIKYDFTRCILIQ